MPATVSDDDMPAGRRKAVALGTCRRAPFIESY